VRTEKETGRGTTAQRTEAHASGSLSGNRPANQADLNGLIADSSEACFVLSAIYQMQVDTNQFLTPLGLVRKIGEWQNNLGPDGVPAVGKDMRVRKGSEIVKDMARTLGLEGGYMGPRTTSPSGNAQATIRTGKSYNSSPEGKSHSNAGDPAGNLAHEVYDGGADHLVNPTRSSSVVSYHEIYYY
jgi:hypothetical protein